MKSANDPLCSVVATGDDFTPRLTSRCVTTLHKGFLCSMPEILVCAYCNYPHADLPKRRRLKFGTDHLPRLEIGELKTPICRGCLAVAIRTRNEPPLRVRAFFSELERKDAEDICRSHDWAGGEAILALVKKAELHLQGLQDEGSALMKRIRRIQIEHAEVAKWKHEIQDKIGQAFRATYEFRRKEANATISRRFVRAIVFSRDGHRCRECDATSKLQVDHIVAVKNGGTDALDNLQTLCCTCNSRKGARQGRFGGFEEP